ncbi:MAG: hypothetical protein ACTSWY_15040 [Promethearchaeota archaeon]
MNNKEITDEIKNLNFLRERLKKNWIFILIFITAGIIAFIFSIVLFRIFVINIIMSPSPGCLGIRYFQEFSVRTLFYALVWLLLYEFLLIVLPTFGFLSALTGIYYFTIVLKEKKNESKEWVKDQEEKAKKFLNWHNRHGIRLVGISSIVAIAMMIIITIDDNSLTTFDSLEIIYFVDKWIEAMFWLAIIAGIPSVIIKFIVFLRKTKQ